MVKEKFVICITSTDKEDHANLLGESIINFKLGACVNIIKLNSIYSWKDRLEKNNEWQVIIKTRLSLSEELMKYIQANHHYELPEIIFIPIIAGTKNYLNWMDSNLKKND